MTDDTLRSVDIERTGATRYLVRNARGGTLVTGTGDDEVFSPVELLLAAIGACTAVDVDLITSRRAEPDTFQIRVTGDKVKDPAGGSRMVNLHVEFTVRFPDGEAGDSARNALPRAVRMSHERLCTVSRTVEAGTPIATTVD
ncbi:MAG: OsmC family protein [Actinobacteria bacterium]|nr:MAG: OsmC family protein [Actinomycetota bacterium]